jgi:hypothetical protein
MTKTPSDNDPNVLADREEHLQRLATELQTTVAELEAQGIRDERRRARRRRTQLLVPHEDRRAGPGRRQDDADSR